VPRRPEITTLRTAELDSGNSMGERYPAVRDHEYQYGHGGDVIELHARVLNLG
jgi:hypothetical protein